MVFVFILNILKQTLIISYLILLYLKKKKKKFSAFLPKFLGIQGRLCAQHNILGRRKMPIFLFK